MIQAPRPADPVTALDVERAAERILPYLLPTPLLPSPWLSERAGVPVLVKWESLQRTGSFKWRGALHKLLCLRDRGVRRLLAVSAGNHGLGVAEAARLLGLQATVVVPASAAHTKVAAIRAAGAELVMGGADYDAAERFARARAEAEGVEFVSPYNDAEVIAGQGTVALEMLAQGRFASLLVPAGGGGLLAGCALCAAAHPMAPAVIGVQPEAAPALSQALARGGVIAAVHEEPTLADGLAGNLEPGSMTVPLLAGRVQRMALVPESAIAEAIVGFIEHDHQIVEGSGAVAAALLLAAGGPGSGAFADGPIGLVVSGRNIDRARLREILKA